MGTLIVEVPNLRFPGFREDWKSAKLGEIVDFKVTNSLSRERLNYKSGTVKNIHYGDIHTKFQTLFDIDKERVPFINEDVPLSKVQEDYYCKDGDLVFADASEDLNDIGKSIEVLNVGSHKVLAGLHTLHGRPKSGVFFPGFAGYLLLSNSVRNQIQREAQGAKVLGISVNRISKVNLIYPSIEEQEKIAVLLSKIDDRIQTQNKIIEDLKLQRQLLVKELFSRKFRFRNEVGAQFPEWKEYKLGDITYVVNTRNKDNKKLPVYSISNKVGFVPQNEQFDGIDSQERGYDIKLYKLIGPNTFAYNPARINVGSIGYSGNLNDIIISSLYVCFKTNDIVDDQFLFQYLRTDLFNKEVLKNVEGGVRDYLFYENFSRIKLLLPGLKEQAKISEFLKLIDDRIDVMSGILEQLSNQKNYFLNCLFL